MYPKELVDGFVVKASGADFKTMNDEDLHPCNIDGNQIGNFEESP